MSPLESNARSKPTRREFVSAALAGGLAAAAIPASPCRSEQDDPGPPVDLPSRYATLDQIMKQLWSHSVGSGIGASWIAKQTGYEALAHETFIAGLLHDVGKLCVLKVMDGMLASREIDNPPSDTVVHEVMESLHTEQGFFLMQQWNLPEKYCLVARDHHLDEMDSNNLVLLMVRLANQVCHKMGIGPKNEPTIVLNATPEANQLQMSEVDLARLEVRLEDSHVFAG